MHKEQTQDMHTALFVKSPSCLKKNPYFRDAIA